MEIYSAEIKKLDGQRITLDLQEALNIERLQTFYFDYDGERMAEVKILDPRQFTPQQRRFVYAILGDIYDFTGQPVESLKEVFYLRYEAITGQRISLSDVSANTVDDVTTLADILIDFCLEWSIPFKKGYEILPLNMEYYLFKCCATRHCCVCGKKADIHHVDVVGMGNNRHKINNTNRDFMALCREHHQEIHQLGYKNFCNKYKVNSVKLNLETLKRLGLGG